MIQRKQTIFLILSLLAYIFLFIVPFASFNLGTVVTCTVGIRGIQGGCEFPRIMFVVMQILATFFITLVGITIFMYKDRPLQLKLCAFAFLTNVAVVGAMFLTTSMIESRFYLTEYNRINYHLPTLIPVFTLVAMWFTVRSIRKDEALARSMDRLR